MSTYNEDLEFAKNLLAICKATKEQTLDDKRFKINDTKYWIDLSFSVLEDNGDYNPDGDNEDDDDCHYIVSVELDGTVCGYDGEDNNCSYYTEDELLLEYGDTEIIIETIENSYFRERFPTPIEYTEEMHFQNSLLYTKLQNRILLVSWYLQLEENRIKDVSVLTIPFKNMENAIKMLYGD